MGEQRKALAPGRPPGKNVPLTQITSNSSPVKCKNPPRHQQSVLSSCIRSSLSYRFVTHTYTQTSTSSKSNLCKKKEEDPDNCSCIFPHISSYKALKSITETSAAVLLFSCHDIIMPYGQ